MQFIGEELLNAAARGENPVRDGNHIRSAAPHDVFPALGEDQWIAIAATDDDAWNALCAIVAPSLRNDPRFATMEGRLSHQDELFEPIAAWTRRHSKFDAATLLQSAGVGAAPVLEAREVAEASYYRDRQFFSRLEHREAGSHDYHTVPIRLSRTPGGDRRAAPCLGQDTETILADILGLTHQQIEALAAAGVTSAIPT
jgi:crotonobetainyl-CoA:carnitine CoA-transferase CaiB-like acyl-CoA transferase